MSVPWPPPSGAPVAPPPRRGSLGLGLLLGVATGIAVLAVGSSTFGWIPVGPPGASVSPSASEPSASEPRPTPVQTQGPVDVTAGMERGIVLITGETASENIAGTGMILSPDGLVLTNYHVVRSTERIAVTIAATGDTYDAVLVGRDATKDVALLQVRGVRRLQPVTLDDDPHAIGDVVVAAGNANGQGYVTANRGNITALGRRIIVRGPTSEDPDTELTGLLETSAPGWPGDSGGPMFDAEEEVLAMTTAGSDTDDPERVIYAIPIQDALAVVDLIRAGDESGTVVIGPRAYLGIVVRQDAVGVEVDRVVSASPASRAGLRAGDTIISVAERDVRTRSELSAVLDDLEPGDQVTIMWRTADGQVRTGEVTLEESRVN